MMYGVRLTVGDVLGTSLSYEHAEGQSAQVVA